MWNSANQSFIAQDYQDALIKYKQIEEQGFVSKELVFNIGNAYLAVNNNLGKAVLYFERALKMDPSYKDAKINLAHAKVFTVDKIDEIPDFFITKWIKSFRNLLSSTGWGTLSLLALAIAVLLLLMFRFANNRAVRKLSFIFALVLFVVFLASVSFAYTENKSQKAENSAIIMSQVSTVKSAPGEGGKTQFMLHEGTKVMIIDSLGEWKRVEIADGRQGWLMNKDLEVI